jgi:hypothetical protein
MKKTVVTRIWFLIVAGALGAAAGGCSSTATPNQEPPAPTISLELRNDGAQSVYLFENCILSYTITALADPVHEITRVDGCACMCGSTCAFCGACAQHPVEVAAGTAMTDNWQAVGFTTETNPASAGGGVCFRAQTLPSGSYRIDVPVYTSSDDAAAGTSARTATQTFTLPAPADHVAVALGVSP